MDKDNRGAGSRRPYFYHLTAGSIQCPSWNLEATDLHKAPSASSPKLYTVSPLQDRSCGAKDGDTEQDM